MRPAYVIAGAAVLLAAGWYAKNKLGALVPAVVREGFDAAMLLAWEGGKIISDPLDGFGVRPGMDVYGNPKWEPTVPWVNPIDPVSNGDSGMNFNYF